MSSDSGYSYSDQKAKSSAIEFTAEDVEANRCGELSDYQFRQIEFKNAVSSQVNRESFYVVLMVMIACIWSGLETNMIGESLILGLILIPFALMMISFTKGTARQSEIPRIQITKVCPVEGEAVVRQKQASQWFSLRIKGRAQPFSINASTAAFFRNPGKYRVYYLEGSDYFLSAEYLPDSLFK